MNELINIDDYFKDYNLYFDADIRSISKEGIGLADGMFIDFATCSLIYNEYNANSILNCVGERKKEDLELVFYTKDKPTIIRFKRRSWFIEFITKTTFKKYDALSQIIIYNGYKLI